jgi:1-acyl-sn-glycerol-3-phosphate acyltransferase
MTTPAATQSSLASRFWYRCCKISCWVACKLLFRYRFSGTEHVPPSGPVLLASNHQSHLDPVLVGVACPRQMKAMARHTLFFWPLSWLIRSLGVLFPEGTRTHDGALQPLMPGFCALARRSEATIVPVTIDGGFRALPRGALLPRRTDVSITFSPPVGPDEYDRLSDTQLVELVTARIAAVLSA